MPNTVLDLIISLDAGEKVTEQELYQLTGQFYKDIAKVGVTSVKRMQGGEEPAGIMGFPIDVNTLIVSLTSAGVLAALIELIKDLVTRAEGRKVKIRTELDGKVIEFEYSPTAVSERELMAFAEKMIQILNRPTIERL